MQTTGASVVDGPAGDGQPGAEVQRVSAGGGGHPHRMHQQHPTHRQHHLHALLDLMHQNFPTRWSASATSCSYPRWLVHMSERHKVLEECLEDGTAHTLAKVVATLPHSQTCSDDSSENSGDSGESSMNPFKRSKYQLSYADGEARPLLRGALHDAVARTLLPLGIGWLFAQEFRGHELLLFSLVGKLFSYSASAFLHRSNATARSTTWQRRALQIDQVAICVSIFSSSLPFACDSFVPFCATYLAAILLSMLLVVIDFGGRSVKLLLTFLAVLNIFFIGWVSQDDSGFYLIGTGFYFLAFLCYIPVGRRHEKGPQCGEAISSRIPWHRQGIIGFHEDFHSLLLLADSCYLLTALHYVCSGGS